MGSITILVENDHFEVSRVIVKIGYQASFPGDEVSKQWVVASGNALVECNDIKRNIHNKESFLVEASAAHRLKNEGDTPLEIIEIKYLVT